MVEVLGEGVGDEVLPVALVVGDDSDDSDDDDEMEAGLGGDDEKLWDREADERNRLTLQLLAAGPENGEKGKAGRELAPGLEAPKQEAAGILFATDRVCRHKRIPRLTDGTRKYEVLVRAGQAGHAGQGFPAIPVFPDGRERAKLGPLIAESGNRVGLGCRIRLF
ncbi:hypothetical protein MKZ38_009476 [Zalerion maritima]|uniref:Uncharacterized protein n=1 Tax=Zalerion maritima TaxID=339359 RepID=A0AAD5WNJ8_9PEZI|nr:hypothetical protein MKZ38_009476 [Zalerion maritima]